MLDQNIGQIILEGSNLMEDVTVMDTRRGVKNRTIAEGTLIECESINRNKRCYATPDMKREINGDRWMELIHTGNAFGEEGHPLSSDLVRQQTLDPKYRVVQYLKTWIDKDKVKAQFRGTNNDLGEAFNADLKDGSKPSFSLRALGTIINENGKAYVRHLKLITFDRVCFPSSKPAYTERVLTESANDYFETTNQKLYRDQQIQMIESMNEHGRIIPITGREALSALNQLQKESASIGTILECFEGITNEVVVVGNRLKLITAYGESMYLPLDEHIDKIIQDYVC